MKTFFPDGRIPIVDREGRMDPSFILFLNQVARHQFNPVDATSGNQSIALPTPTKNLNVEWIYLKSDNGVHTVTITGAVTGNQVLSTQGASARFKSDGTNWWKV